MVKKGFKMTAREKILTAATEEFSEKGYAAASISLITKKAGVNKAMVNYYFGSKEKLYHKVLLSMINVGVLNKIDDFYKKLQTYRLDPAQSLYCRIYVKLPLVTVRNQKAGKFLWREMLNNRAEYKGFIKEVMAERATETLKIIKQGIKQGYFQCSSPEHLLISEQLTALFIHFLPLIEDEPKIETSKEADLNKIRKYSLERVFKTLAVSGKPIYPEIPKKIKKEMDIFIKELINEGGFIND